MRSPAPAVIRGAGQGKRDLRGDGAQAGTAPLFRMWVSGFSRGLRMEGFQQGGGREVRHSELGAWAAWSPMCLEGGSEEGGPLGLTGPASAPESSSTWRSPPGALVPLHPGCIKGPRGPLPAARLPRPPGAGPKRPGLPRAPSAEGKEAAAAAPVPTRLEPPPPALLRANKRDRKPCVCTKRPYKWLPVITTFAAVRPGRGHHPQHGPAHPGTGTAPATHPGAQPSPGPAGLDRKPPGPVPQEGLRERREQGRAPAPLAQGSRS